MKSKSRNIDKISSKNTLSSFIDLIAEKVSLSRNIDNKISSENIALRANYADLNGKHIEKGAKSNKNHKTKLCRYHTDRNNDEISHNIYKLRQSTFEHRDNCDRTYFFRSQINKKYAVDYFEFENIKKLFVTVNLKEKTNSSKEHGKCEQNMENEPVTEILNPFGTFNNKKNKIVSRNTCCDHSCSAEKEITKCVLNDMPSQKEDCTSPNPSELNSDKKNVLSNYSNIRRSLEESEKGLTVQPEEEFKIESKELTAESEEEFIVDSKMELASESEEVKAESANEFVVESMMELAAESDQEVTDESEELLKAESDHEVITIESEEKVKAASEIDDNPYYLSVWSNHYCAHCFYKFLNNDDNYNHKCPGKQEEGFLCVYCERLFSSYEILQNHMEMHLST